MKIFYASIMNPFCAQANISQKRHSSSALGLPATALAMMQLLELQCSNDHVTIPIISDIMLLLINIIERCLAKSEREP